MVLAEVSKIIKRNIIERSRKRKRETVNLTRKRERQESTWIDNKAKEKRAKGEEGFGRKGPINARKLKPGCSDDCRFKCQEKITLEDRLTAFNDYYKLAEKVKQWQCISNWVSIKLKKELDTEALELAQIYNKSKKEKTFYQFTLPTQNGPICVCRTMFLDTLGKS